MKTIDQNIIPKKTYNKPVVAEVILDNSISLVMMTAPVGNPDPRTRAGGKGADESFKSPFGDKPFG